MGWGAVAVGRGAVGWGAEAVGRGAGAALQDGAVGRLCERRRWLFVGTKQHFVP